MFNCTEKREEKKALQEKLDSLNTELGQLKERHSELTVKLKNQATERESELERQSALEKKINGVIAFVKNFQHVETAS